MFESERLKFKDEFEVEVPKEILHDFMLQSWEITREEFEEPQKIEIERGKDELVWNFDTGKGINHRKIIFNKSDSDRTKVIIHEELPDITSFLTGTDQKLEGESYIVGNKILYNSLEYIYKNDFSDFEYDTDMSESKTPFYMKEYSSTLGPDIDIPATYSFVKKRYQLFDEMKRGYPTLEDKKKSIIVDKKGRCLKIKSKRRFGDLQTVYYFQKNNPSGIIDIRFWVPYWNLLSKFDRMEFTSTFRALRTMVKSFDYVYSKYMKSGSG